MVYLVTNGLLLVIVMPTAALCVVCNDTWLSTEHVCVRNLLGMQSDRPMLSSSSHTAAQEIEVALCLLSPGLPNVTFLSVCLSLSHVAATGKGRRGKHTC